MRPACRLCERLGQEGFAGGSSERAEAPGARQGEGHAVGEHLRGIPQSEGRQGATGSAAHADAGDPPEAIFGRLQPAHNTWGAALGGGSVGIQDRRWQEAPWRGQQLLLANEREGLGDSGGALPGPGLHGLQASARRARACDHGGHGHGPGSVSGLLAGAARPCRAEPLLDGPCSARHWLQELEGAALAGRGAGGQGPRGLDAGFGGVFR
mmetsp:Transcript_104167/g.290185  ORF Transcript_104167/g.290185 Transcript_104167/m.290185 type:complete len:210 (+) Transcript_104167:778-1407(+)